MFNNSITSALLSNLPSIVGFIGGFFTALFAEPLRQRLYRAKLSLSFGSSSDFIARTLETSGQSQYQAIYIRLKVVNTSTRLAKACRAYLVGIEKQKDNKFEPTVYCDSMQLQWSVRGADERFGAIDLPQDVPQFVDVVSTRSISTYFAPATAQVPLRYMELFKETGIFRFRVQVSGDGVKPVWSEVILHWDGKWDKFSVEE